MNFKKIYFKMVHSGLCYRAHKRRYINFTKKLTAFETPVKMRFLNWDSVTPNFTCRNIKSS